MCFFSVDEIPNLLILLQSFQVSLWRIAYGGINKGRTGTALALGTSSFAGIWVSTLQTLLGFSSQNVAWVFSHWRAECSWNMPFNFPSLRTHTGHISELSRWGARQMGCLRTNLYPWLSGGHCLFLQRAYNNQNLGCSGYPVPWAKVFGQQTQFSLVPIVTSETSRGDRPRP